MLTHPLLTHHTVIPPILNPLTVNPPTVNPLTVNPLTANSRTANPPTLILSDFDYVKDLLAKQLKISGYLSYDTLIA